MVRVSISQQAELRVIRELPSFSGCLVNLRPEEKMMESKHLRLVWSREEDPPIDGLAPSSPIEIEQPSVEDIAFMAAREWRLMLEALTRDG